VILIELILDAPPGYQDDVAELARRTMAATQQEQGCILYRFTTGLDRPTGSF
jgi:quinol monooxygenase YgiN